MPTISEAFPSKYLKGDDLNGSEPVVTIRSVLKEKVGDGEKFVVYFEGRQKGLVLNRTDAEAIGMLYGDTFEHWAGETVTLYSTPVTFQGKTTNAVRVRPPRKAARKHTEENPPPNMGAHLNDEAPF